MISCLFCNDIETGSYKPSKAVEFICSSCVILLADMNQENLLKAYSKAKEKNYAGKMSAIESFLITKGDMNEVRKNDRHNDRKRSMRNIGHEKVRHNRIKAKSRLAIL